MDMSAPRGEKRDIERNDVTNQDGMDRNGDDNPPESSPYTVVPHWYHNSSSANTYVLLLPLDTYHREWYTRVGPFK